MTAQRHFYLIDAEGNQLFGSTEEAELPEGACEVPRLPGPFECWDAQACAFTYDAERHANAKAGLAHIKAMHTRKAIEAHLISAGVSAPGMMVVREAALRGITPVELAAIVRAKAAEAEELELERQAASLSGPMQPEE